MKIIKKTIITIPPICKDFPSSVSFSPDSQVFSFLLCETISKGIAIIMHKNANNINPSII